MMTGEIVEVDLSESGTGSMLAKRIKLEEQVNQEALKGTITSVDSNTQFHMVVFNEEPTLSSVSEGAPVVVTILPNASFEASSEEMGENGGSRGSASLALRTCSWARRASTAPGCGVRRWDQNDHDSRIRLRPSQITGQVGTINSD